MGVAALPPLDLHLEATQGAGDARLGQQARPLSLDPGHGKLQRVHFPPQHPDGLRRRQPHLHHVHGQLEVRQRQDEAHVRDPFYTLYIFWHGDGLGVRVWIDGEGADVAKVGLFHQASPSGASIITLMKPPFRKTGTGLVMA